MNVHKSNQKRYDASIMRAPHPQRPSAARQTLARDQNGFIPMIICLILLIVVVLYVSYQHVAQAQH